MSMVSDQIMQTTFHFPEAECLPLLRNSLKLVVCLQTTLTPPNFELQGIECKKDSDLLALAITTDHSPTRSRHGKSRRQMIPWCSLDNFLICSAKWMIWGRPRRLMYNLLLMCHTVSCILTFYVWFLLGLQLGFRVYSNRLPWSTKASVQLLCCLSY